MRPHTVEMHFNIQFYVVAVIAFLKGSLHPLYLNKVIIFPYIILVWDERLLGTEWTPWVQCSRGKGVGQNYSSLTGGGLRA